MLSFKEFQKSKFLAYKTIMGSLHLTKPEDRLVYWTENQKTPSVEEACAVTVYGTLSKKYPDLINDLAYALSDKKGYVNTGHGHARVEAKDGETIEEALYKAMCRWEEWHKDQATNVR